jgi:hypothetical protein
MNEKPKREPEPITKKTVVYDVPGTDTVIVRRDLVYGPSSGESLTMDVYGPPNAGPEARLPVVVLVAGYPDPGVERVLGCRFKDMGSSTSWARLIAASGLSAVLCTNRDPVADLRALLRHLRDEAPSLGLDSARMALWASSGNVPLALWALMQEEGRRARCAVFCYGYTLDSADSTFVAEASSQWQFVHPVAGTSVRDLPPDIPLFVARAGRDTFPGLNETLDRFVADCLRDNLPVTVVNLPEAPHAFDLFDDGEMSRETIRRILDFLRFHLGHRGSLTASPNLPR